MKTLYQQMNETCQRVPQKDAVVFYGKRLKFKDILSLVDRAAAGLKKEGVTPGCTVTLCMPNTPSAQIAFYALNRIGAIVNLVHPHISAAQLNVSMKKTNTRLLIAYDLYLGEKGTQLDPVPMLKSESDYFMGGVAKLYFKTTNRKKLGFKAKTFESLFRCMPDGTHPAEFPEDAPAVFLPSGGTVGTPKIIMHSNRVFNGLCSHAQFFLSEDISNYGAMYSVLPIFHGFGLCMNMHMCVTIGIKNVMSIKFNPKQMARAIKKEKINVITGVPAMFTKLLNCGDFLKADLSPVKDCFAGGDNVPKKLVDEFNSVLKRGGSKAALYPGYGLTETVTVCTVGSTRRNKPDSIGVPLPDTYIKIISGGKEVPCGEVGEICVKTPLMMLGYLGCDDESPVKMINGEEWLFTGDLGYVDAEGFVYFKQRIKNMIKVNGVPVFPSEIEDVIEKVAGVGKVAAIGVPDEKTTEAVKIFIEPSRRDLSAPETSALQAEIMARCKADLIHYAVPKYIEIRESLPLNAIGKIDRKALM